MDQIKIGAFIAQCRKKKKLTQMQLAEKLGITDRAVSKWERGLSLPDASIMLALCAELGISVNDLLNGEVVAMENDRETMEKNLLEMVRLKQESDRRLLRLEIVLGILSAIPFLAALVLSVFSNFSDSLRILLLLLGLLFFLAATPFMFRIEQVAGYYECRHCHYRYVPTYKSVLLAQHVNRTRYMRCPKCQKKSWQKKVLKKEEE